MTFDNYIFDLYGTLIDIHTDESIPGLWQDMAAYLEYHFGAGYAAKELRQRYLEVCKEEEKALRNWLAKTRKMPTDHPEIRISWVWSRLIGEKLRMPQGPTVTDPSVDTEKILETMDSYKHRKYDEEEYITPEIQAVCNYFRETSRDKLIRYDGVDTVFRKLKDQGKKIFLLSNAQRAFTAKELMECGLDSCFDGIFISSDLLMKKPEPKFMDLLVDKYELDKSKCVMIGNEISCDVGVAAGSGIRSIFLNTSDVSDSRIKQDINRLDIRDEELFPIVIRDGKIEKILSL